MNFTIHPKIYPMPLEVFIKSSKKEMTKVYKKWKIDPTLVDDVDLKGADGKFIMYSNNVSVLRIPWKPKTPWQISCLQHEILHYVCEVMRRIGIPLSETSEEAYTYLQGYITKKIMEKLK